MRSSVTCEPYCMPRAGSTHHQHKKHQWWATWEVVPVVRERSPSTQKTSTEAPCEAVLEVWDCPPSTQKTSVVGPLGGGVGSPRAPTFNAKNVDDRLPGRWGRRSRSAHYQHKKTSMAGPLGGSAGGPRAPAINAKNVDGVHPGRHCQRSGSAPHPRKKYRRQAPWEVRPEVREHPPSTQKMSMAGP
jgi:hypothetical protein